MNREQDLHQIDAFFRGELSAAEEQTFQKRLNEDADFKILFEEQKSIFQAMRLRKRQDLFEQMEAFEQEASEQAKAVKATTVAFNWRRWASVAAVGLLLAIATYFLTRPRDSKPQYADIAKEHFEPYAPIGMKRAGEKLSQEDSLYQLALREYEAKAWQEAEELFIQSNKSNKKSLAQFYIGNIAMEQENYKKASIDFDAFLKDAQTYNLEKETQWQLALAHIANQELEKAKRLLEGLKNKKYKLTQIKDIEQQIKFFNH